MTDNSKEQPMEKTAEEVLSEVTERITGSSYVNDAIVTAMKIYANMKLDMAAEQSTVSVTTAYTQSRTIETKTDKKFIDSYPNFCVKTIQVNINSILSLKDNHEPN